MSYTSTTDDPGEVAGWLLGPDNPARYESEQVQGLIALRATQADLSKRVTDTVEAERIAQDNTIYSPLWWGKTSAAFFSCVTPTEYTPFFFMTLWASSPELAKQMLRYILHRLVGATVVLILLSFLVFSLLYLIPGGPAKILVGTRRLTPGVRQAVIARYSLDELLIVRYWHWLTRALTGDFEDSARSATPVTDAFASCVSLTAWLIIGVFILTVAVGVPPGIAVARRRGSWVDRTVVSWPVVGVSAPGFAFGPVLLYISGLMLGWFPIFDEGTGLVDALWHLTLPAIALATGVGAMLVRITRAAVSAELSQDYVTSARSRGVPHRRTTAMCVRGAALPIITSTGLILGALFGSTVLVKEASSLPGLGQLLADSIIYKDVPVVQAIALLVAFVIIVVTLIVDVAAFTVDLRQTIGDGRGT